MKIPFLFLLLLCQTIVNGQHYFQQEVNYKINVTLNDVDNTLDGFEIIDYTNNSPDTLQFIWFHLWPNAYKNDRTAFSEQLLRLGRTGFYFSNEKQRGYINRLNFKIDGITSELEDHPQYIDVVKLILPTPLPPGNTIKITTPFHEKIPYNFSRGGYVNHTYQITQWYPKPAVYDNQGWHPMPYLDQGEFYSEFGDFEVHITVPENYVIAATGELQNEDERKWLKERAPQVSENTQSTNSNQQPVNKNNDSTQTPKKTKTLTYIQHNVHDFAWFADKSFIVKLDTLQLPSGKIIDVGAYFTPEGKDVWKNSISFLKEAIKTRSKWLGEYPYNIVTAVEARMGFSGGMEYPTITSISPMDNEKDLNLTIEHEVGHNWNYGILASNERLYPWMDEGMNTYFDNRYESLQYPNGPKEKKQGFLQKRLPDDFSDLMYRMQISSKRDQPISTSSVGFSEINYGVIAYYKAGMWMKLLEQQIGKTTFDYCLHKYYQQWKFKHPYPNDFKKIITEVSNKNMDSLFSLLHKKGLMKPPQKKKTKIASFFNFKETDKYNYVFLSPAFGYNYYDKIMIGGIVHNYTLPLPRFHFFAAPFYASGSKAFNGIARVGYHFLSYGFLRKIALSISGEKFTMDDFVDSTGTKNYMGFTKITPSIKIYFRNNNPTSSITKYIQWKTFLIEETNYYFSRDTVNQIDIISYPKEKRYLNQLTFSLENNRALYPYSGKLIAEQAKGFLRFAFEGKYYFNYEKEGGLNARLFAGKYIPTGNKIIYNDRYYLNMSGPNGYEDYTYSNYFIGRNEFRGATSQQMMIRDGGFKVRTDLLSQKVGKTDNWLMALNLKTDFPKGLNPLQVLPFEIPLKIFLDVGTYAEAWKKEAYTGKFIYDAGLQVSLLKDVVNIYIPILYSKVYGDYFKQTIPKEKRFWQNISFSIDIQNFKLDKFFGLPTL